MTLTAVQHRVLELHNQMQMSPQEFSYRWSMDYEILAQLCCLSKSTTYHWLGGQGSRRTAGAAYQRILAVADLLLTQAEQVQPLLEDWQQHSSS